MALEPDDSRFRRVLDISVTNEGDLGVGDRSAVLGYEPAAVFIMPIEIELDVVFQVGSDVVGLVHTVSGELHVRVRPGGGTPGDRRFTLAGWTAPRGPGGSTPAEVGTWGRPPPAREGHDES